MRRSTLLALILQGFLSPSIADDRICRFPSGKATDDVPCTSDTNTFCCAPGAICMDNGYCYNIAEQPFMLSRGTCTDRNWGTSCPQKCTGENNDWDRGSVIIFLEDNDDSPTYCCDGLEWNSDNNSMGCVTGSEPFQLDAGKAMIGVAALKGLALSDSEDHDAGVINIRQMSNSTAKPEGNGTSSTGSNPTATACFNATTLPGTSNNSGGNSGKEAAIGAGVGVPLGLIAVASLAWAIWLQRQNRNLRKAQTQTQTQGGGQGQFLGQMGYGAQSGMMPSGGYMNHGPVTYGHHGHHHGRFVELGEMDGDPKELSGMSSKQSV